MKHYLSLHLESARNAARHFIRQPLATLLILLMLAIAMTLPLALYLGVQSGQAVLGKLNEAPQITLYMELSADEVDNEAVKTLLAEDARISKSEFIGKQKGLQELQQSMGAQDLVSMLDDNPLPDVFIVTPDAGTAPEAMQILQQDLSELPMVEAARLDTEWMQTLYQINAFLHRIFWFLAITLSVAFVLVAHNTIRLQILSQKEEIEITKLLGAPSSFIRRPFLYQAWWQGCLALLISLGLCWYLIRLSTPMLQALFAPYGLQLTWRFFTLPELLILLGLMSVLAVFGATFATRQHLRHFRAKTH